MGDLKLFQLDQGKAVELSGTAMTLEKSLQTLIEHNMETLFGVRCLASEYSTGKKHGGRMDSLGIDENGNPVIFEYKRAVNENVITQGLFYLDWLMDHRGDFELLVLKQLGSTVTVDWSNPRLVCVAGDFTRYDEHAVGQMNRSIELVRYRSYNDRLLALELVASTAAKATAAGEATMQTSPTASATKTVSQLHAAASERLKDVYDALEQYLLNLGDDVTKIVNKNYYAFRRLKNFACVEVHPQSGKVLVYVKVNPDEVSLVKDFSRDVRSIGHFGTGDLELTLTNTEDITRAQRLLDLSYAAS
ncbi:DUF5655 domain-containing protein [Geodermatophilus sp. URMC 60]